MRGERADEAMRYHNAAPFALVALLGLALYCKADANLRTERDYEALVTSARAFAAEGIVVDAVARYKDALELSDSPELRMEVAGLYREAGLTRAADDWCEDTARIYPNEAAPYEFLMELRCESGDIVPCIEVYMEMKELGITSPKCEDIMDEVEYAYRLTGRYEDAAIMFSGGYGAVMTNGQWGYIDESGTSKLRPTYAEAGPFGPDGRAAVTDARSDTYYIDIKGNKRAAPPQVAGAHALGLMENGSYTLYGPDGWSIYGSGNNPIAGPFERLTSIRDGRAAAFRDGLWFLTDSGGADITGDGYDDVKTDDSGAAYSGGRFFAMSDGLYCMYDGDGRRVSDAQYEDCAPFAASGGGYAAVRLGGKWGFADNSGNLVIEPIFEDARSFSNGLAAVRRGGRWGYIDPSGDMAIDCIFELAGDFGGKGCAMVKTEGKWKMLRLEWHSRNND
jgi:hypothetical protein